MPLISSHRLGTVVNSTIMKSVRKPVFVDNALHLGEYTGQTNIQNKVTIKQKKTATYGVATGRAYDITELENSMIVKHPQTHSSKYQGSVFYMDSTITDDNATNKPVLFYAKGLTHQRLRPSNVMNSGVGTTYSVKNTKSKSFVNLGFESTQAHIAQPIDVGLRTTDLAMRISRDIADTLTSVNISLPLSAANSKIDRRRHSHVFLGTDFHGITLIDALRFIGRHDGRVVHFDRFGNLLYVPFQFEEGSRVVNAAARVGDKINNPIENISNRVIVEGLPTAVNDTAFAEINDSEKQSGSNGEILEEPQIVGDFTVRSNEQAREVGRNILKANSVMKGNLSSNGHPNSWDLRPGMIIQYEGRRKILVEVRHNLAKNTADLVFLSVESGVEGVLQGILEGTRNTGKQQDTIQQVIEKNLAFFGDVEIVSIIMTEKTVHGLPGDGFIIGKGMARGVLGVANAETMGGSKSTKIIEGGE